LNLFSLSARLRLLLHRETDWGEDPTRFYMGFRFEGITGADTWAEVMARAVDFLLN
jgi:hypothetical protein